MSLFVESYGTVFEPKFQPKAGANYSLKTISINEGKDEKTGKTIYSSWNGHFVGKAKDAAASLAEKTNIKFKGFVKKVYNSESKKEYVYINIYEFEPVTGETKVSTTVATTTTEEKIKETFPDVDINVTDEDLPF